MLKILTENSTVYFYCTENNNEATYGIYIKNLLQKHLSCLLCCLDFIICINYNYYY